MSKTLIKFRSIAVGMAFFVTLYGMAMVGQREPFFGVRLPLRAGESVGPKPRTVLRTELSRFSRSLRIPDALSPNGAAEMSAPIHLVQPSPLSGEDDFYRDYFSSNDNRIARAYLDRWSFHNQQRTAGWSAGDPRHVDIGSLDFYNNAPREVDVRRGFAEQVLRIRFDYALRAYFRPDGRGTGIKNAEKALNSLRNQAVKLSSSPSNRSTGELRFGYDVFTDFSKIEFVGGTIEGGLYHTFLLSAMAGARSNGRPVYAQVVAKPGPGLPVPSLRYRFDNRTIEASVAKQITSNVTGAVVSTQPTLNNGVETSYGMTLSYRF